jgi:cobalt/nickel transport system permease protein
MFTEPFTRRDSLIHRLDPRGRLIAALAFAILLAVCRRPSACLVGLSVALVLWPLARLPFWATVKRFAAFNVFMLTLILLLPLGVDGRPMWQLGPLCYTWEGLERAATIAVRGNAIVLVYTALVSTMNPFVLGHALDHLFVPRKLTLLYCLTARYVGTLKQEYDRLRTAMRVRGFRSRTDLHTFRSLGHLVGMLMVRSFDRSDRVWAAMKCRGFRGTFWLLDHFVFTRRDLVFAVVVAAALLIVGSGEWLIQI